MPDRSRRLLRARGASPRRVAAVELFFDLVFIFAVTQLSHRLIEHFSVLGATQALLLLIGVWWAWIYTTWLTNWLDPEKLPVRTMLLALVFPGLVGAAAIPGAFETHGMALALAYLSIQVGRTLFFLWAATGNPQTARTFQRVLVWLLVGGVFWVIGALVDTIPRMWLWGMALGLEFVSPWLSFRVPGLGRSRAGEWEIDGAYIAERCGLFIIIALGESILVTGFTFSASAWTVANMVTLATSLTGTIAMWWLYFDTTAEIGLDAISKSNDPDKLARFAYTYVHILLVAGIIVAAVADEFVLRDTFGRANARATIAILTSAGVYLLGTLLFLWVATGQLPQTPATGLAATLALAPLAPFIPPVVLMALTATVLFVTALHESHRRRHREFEIVPVA
jgi:low temperature requirement protein LtrA